MKYLVTLTVEVPDGVPNPKENIEDIIPAALEDFAVKYGIWLNPKLKEIICILEVK
jgi:hypothetical protein